MSQQVKVERELVFQGPADYLDNIRGNPSFKKVVLYDDFLGVACDETNDWKIEEDFGGTGAIVAAANGVYRLTTGTTDDDKVEMGKQLCWYAELGCIIEVRLKVDVITNAKINVGFSDDVDEADNLTAFNISGTTMAATCTDGVCFVFDTDGSAAYWYIANSKPAGVAGISIAVAPVAATYEVFRIKLDTLGNATYYRNGVAKGYKALAVTTTAPLTPYVAVQLLGNAGVARNLDVDYIKIWQNRS